MIDAGSSKALLTGDAGIPALSDVLDRLAADGLVPAGFDLVQVPHHGSRRNVDSEVLDRLLGPIGARTSRGAALASAAKDAPKHPRQRVTNAFRRRGYPVVATKGQTITYSWNTPRRPGWGPVEPLPFYDEITDEDE